MSIEAMKQALEVIEAAIKAGDWKVDGACDPDMAIHNLRQAIEQAEKQKPVACVQDLDEVKRKHLVYEKGMDWKDPLYATPQPQREWVGLMRGVRVEDDTVVITVKGGNEAARQLCAELLKEKNT